MSSVSGYISSCFFHLLIPTHLRKNYFTPKSLPSLRQKGLKSGFFSFPYSTGQVNHTHAIIHAIRCWNRFKQTNYEFLIVRNAWSAATRGCKPSRTLVHSSLQPYPFLSALWSSAHSCPWNLRFPTGNTHFLGGKHAFTDGKLRMHSLVTPPARTYHRFRKNNVYDHLKWAEMTAVTRKTRSSRRMFNFF